LVSGATTRQELAEVGGVSESSIDRYQAGESSPQFDTVWLWANRHPNPNVRSAVRLSVGAPVSPDQQEHHYDPQAARDVSIAINGQAHTTLDAVNDVLRDGRVTREEEAKVVTQASRAKALLNRLVEGVTSLRERRRQAKAFG
jgi:transcriptional regulator with XRE-family HTH domain